MLQLHLRTASWRLLALLLFPFVLPAALAPSAADVPTYQVTDMGTYVEDLGYEDDTSLLRINASSHVVGTTWFPGAPMLTAFMRDRSGALVNLGSLGGPSHATAINASGQVAGWSYLVHEFENYDRHAVVWDRAHGLQDLGSLGTSSVAEGINASGQVVGFTDTPEGLVHAFLWDASGGMQDLGTLGGSTSIAYGINARGQVVGFSGTVDEDAHAFIWERGRGMQDLGTLGGTFSVAYAINVRGQVVGYSETDAGEWHAFLWDRSHGMQDLGSVGGFSVALGINAAGQVVGVDYSVGAVLWQDGKGLILSDLLADAGQALMGASDINDAGEIVGIGLNADWIPAAVLLTPAGGRLVPPGSGRP